jgi:hypothetical protein
MGIVLLGLPPFCILGGFIFLAFRRNQTFSTVGQASLPVLPPVRQDRPGGLSHSGIV